ncbi:hypothetical protein [Comamonas odontotermitis]|uniref:DUF4148 domain-containing protein n=1 Tax=Comamonas odontotermitis TaxID=379895 RepID=A0ABR6RA17_9BURK|nr:hypothetical protein [Comamonas odontotermitis]MBB6575991.1 hypothetical protein [Comamonas odontotermitis]UBB16773.1 hypothetical protein LAD35_18590 [Comamonas odontotermitis]
MNARILAIAATLALGATVANANPFEGDQAIAARATATSAVSRADVQAQLADAQKNHTMVVQGDKVAVNAYEMGKGQLSRAEVTQAAHQAMVNGSIVEGE